MSSIAEHPPTTAEACAAFFDHSPDPILVFDLQGTPAFQNRKATATFGAMPLSDQLDSASAATLKRAIKRAARSSFPSKFRVDMQGSHFLLRAWRTRATPLMPEPLIVLSATPIDDFVTYGAAMAGQLQQTQEERDRANKRAARLREEANRLRRLASTDQLTKLLNAGAFKDALRHRAPLKGCLFLLDLDGFKPLNDTYGHAAGDKALCFVAKALTQNMRSYDVVGRIGGDEFVFWADGMTSDQVFDFQVRLQTALEQPFIWRGNGQKLRLHIDGTFGCAMAEPGMSIAALLAKADEDMYRNKASQRRA